MERQSFILRGSDDERWIVARSRSQRKQLQNQNADLQISSVVPVGAHNSDIFRPVAPLPSRQLARAAHSHF